MAATAIQVHRRMAVWATAAAGLALVVIVLGAWTRLVHAGLGCPDWPGCYGFLTVPLNETHIAIANARFPDSPVDVTKGWPEMIHRYAAGTLGLCVFALAALAVRYRHAGVPWRLPVFIAAFVVLQAAFGMWTVTLKLWPQVVALHLLGGFTTLALLTLLSLRLWHRVRRPGRPVDLPRQPAPAGARPWLYLALVLVVLQISLGAWTAANYAAAACPDLPTCQGQWWPAGMDFRHGFDVTQQVGPNYLGGQLDADGRVAIHVSHRLGALVLLLYLSGLLLWLWRQHRDTGLGPALLLVAAALGAQIILGMASVVLHFPLLLAVAHNAMGAGLLLAVIHLIWRHHLLLPRPVRAARPAGSQQEVTA